MKLVLLVIAIVFAVIAALIALFNGKDVFSHGALDWAMFSLPFFFASFLPLTSFARAPAPSPPA